MRHDEDCHSENTLRGCTVDLFRPGDATGIAHLFRSIYGEHYPHKTVYEPEALIRACEEGSYFPVVARNGQDEVVEYTTFYRTAPFEGVYECGQGLVAERFRRQGISSRLLRHAVDVLGRRPDMQEVFGEASCAQLALQKAAASLGYKESALALDAIPPSVVISKENAAFPEEKVGNGIASLLMFRCLRQESQRIYLPSVYASRLRSICSWLDRNRHFTVAREGWPSGFSTRADSSWFPRSHRTWITVSTIGDDLHHRLGVLEREGWNQGARTIHVRLSLGSPWIGRAVDLLRSRGFFLGGLLPRWFDRDGLLLQKVRDEPDFGAIQLYSARAMELLSWIEADWRATTRLRPAI